MASWKVGNRKCQAAIFMYKNDNSVDKVKPEIERINTDQGKVPNGCPTDGICGEHHTDKEEFMGALGEWNSFVQPNNSFLCIYAHANEEGILPLFECTIEEYQKDLITWQELAEVLTKPVQYLWLLGCTTRRSMEVWSPINGPVSGLLLATSLDIHWGDFVRAFEDEISLDPIRSVNEMIEAMRDRYPNLAHHTQYFRSGKDGWLPVELPQSQ
jgi:hypothetical protein